MKPPGTKRLKLNIDILLATSAFKFNLRRYSMGAQLLGVPQEAGAAAAAAMVMTLPAALALHAATHAVLCCSGGAGAAVVLRRVLHRPTTAAVLRGMLHTPLTQRRRPAVARAAAARARGVRSAGGAGRLWGGEEPFGPGAAFGVTAPSADVEARRAVMLAACGEDAALRAELRDALVAAVPYPLEEEEEEEDWRRVAGC